MGMTCPRCHHTFDDSWNATPVGDVKGLDWTILHTLCPNCKQFVVRIQAGLHGSAQMATQEQIYPKSPLRERLPLDSLGDYSSDYAEACAVFVDSPRASAALSRRCLQRILRDEAKMKPANLNSEIEEVLASGQLPSLLAEAIGAIRAIGNFAAHPLKGTNTGEIVDVEPGEAEWTLNVLEGLLDFYVIQPGASQKKPQDPNEKLEKAGNPRLK